jgi:anti-anti-sigma regulatory factor
VPFFDIPVIVPYRLEADAAVTYSLQVQAVASGPQAASAVAAVITASLARWRHGGQAIAVLGDRIRIGPASRQVDGPYAYVLGRGNHVAHLTFPSRLDNEAGERMGSMFAALDESGLHGLIMDCHLLTSINTAGLVSIATHARRLHLHLMRLTGGVRKVFEIVRLDHLVPLHDTIQQALDDLERERLAPAVS